jgi:hypothetical protein
LSLKERWIHEEMTTNSGYVVLRQTFHDIYPFPTMSVISVVEMLLEVSIALEFYPLELGLANCRRIEQSDLGVAWLQWFILVCWIGLLQARI